MALTTITNAMVSVNAIQGTLIADNAITAVHIATNAVSGTLVADNAITATHIAQNTITVTQIADDAIESAKIADGIITTNHLNKAMISSQTEVAVATGDFVLIGDTSDSNNLKKAPISSILAGTLTTAAQTNITSVGTLTGLTVSYSGTGNLVELISTDAGSSTAPDLSFYRNSSSPADNDNIGLIRFYGNDDGGNKTSYAAIHAYIADASDGSSDGGLIFSTTRADIQAPTGAAESLRITETGKVGIGTTSPDHNLVVRGSANTNDNIFKVEDSDGTSMAAMQQDSSGNGRWIVYDTSGNADVLIHTAGNSYFNGGNVGIGINTPLDILHLNDDNDDCVINLDTAVANKNSVIKFSDPDAQGVGFLQYAHFDGTLRFHVESAERMRITSTGGVLVGTATNQLYDTTSQTGIALHDTASYSSCGAHIEIANDADSGWSPVYIQRFDWAAGDDGRFLQFAINGGSDVGNITYDGTNFAVTNGSDYRLKENIVDYTGGLAKINALKVRSFNKKEGASKDITQQGFIAHELAEHIPNAVIGTKDAMKVDETGKTVPDYQQVTREGLVPYLVSAIQELEARIKTLEGA